MIVCHSHRFIFIKPRKVAGTTIELKLSNFLNSGDLATSIEPEEEHLRVSHPGVKIGPIIKKNRLGIQKRLRDHSTLQKAYSMLDEKVQNYLVVSASRNPWDRAVSQFFWSNRKKNILTHDLKFQKREFNKFTKFYGPKKWIDTFYGRKRQRRLNSSHLYSINNNIAANFIIRFEHLEEDFLALTRMLNLPKYRAPGKFNTKSSFRSTESKEWQKFYETDTIELVRKCCAEEIFYFNYNFEGTSNPIGQNLTFPTNHILSKRS